MLDRLNERYYSDKDEPLSETTNTQSYYKGKDSLYKFAEEKELNSYEFDLIKRICRCRYKGNFIEDLNKTKDLIDIYLKEQGGEYGK